MAEVVNIVVRMDSNQVERFAAEELAAYTGAMTGRKMNVINEASGYASPSIFQYPALLWDVESDLKSQLLDFCENYYGDRSAAEAFQLDEQADPNDTSVAGWDALKDRYARASSIVKEILQGSTDDIHIQRLGRLMRELEHTGSWVDDKAE